MKGQTMPRQEESYQPTTRRETDMNPYEDFVQYLRRYSRERPETVAWACLGIGFILGWKLKPW